MPTLVTPKKMLQAPSPSELPPAFALLLQKQRELYAKLHSRKNLEPLLQVSDAVRSVAGFYERTRNTLEYHDADIVRRIAIERALKRLVIFGGDLGRAPQGERLLKELIRGGYFPNDAIPESVMHDVTRTLERFGAMQTLGVSQEDERLARSLTATEIEEDVLPEERVTEDQFAAFAFEVFRDRLPWPEALLQDPRHTTMIYLAIWRSIIKADEPRTIAAVIHQAFPLYRTMSAREARVTLPEVVRAFRAVRLLLRSPQLSFYRKAIRPYAPSLEALRDAFWHHKNDMSELSRSPILLEEALNQSVQERFENTRKDLYWSALRATMYVFLTKMVVALAIELPLDVLFKSFLPQTFVINLLGPPFLMAVVAFTAKVPGEKVAVKIVDDAMRIAVETGEFGAPRRRIVVRTKMRSVVLMAAAVIFIAVAFTATAKILSVFHFSLLAGITFVFFVSLVSLFAYRIRRTVRELNIVPVREGFSSIVGDLISFPFLALGKILSEVLEGVNVFLFVLDIFIESPLKSLLSFLEDWLSFLREKREEFVGEA